MLLSVLVRFCYGGMEFDKVLLYNTLKLWLSRYSTNERESYWNSKILAKKTPRHSIAMEGFTNVDQICLAGLDYHCANWLVDKTIDLLGNTYPLPSDKQNFVKELMWNYRSSINFKKNLTNDDQTLQNKQHSEIFKSIEKELDRITVSYFEKRI